MGVTQQKYVRKIAEACSAQRQGEMGVKWSGVQWTRRMGWADECSVWAWHICRHTYTHTHFRFPGAPHPDAIIKFYQPGSKHPVAQDTRPQTRESASPVGPCCTLIDFQVGHVISFWLFAATTVAPTPLNPLSFWFCVSHSDPDCLSSRVL